MDPCAHTTGHVSPLGLPGHLQLAIHRQLSQPHWRLDIDPCAHTRGHALRLGLPGLLQLAVHRHLLRPHWWLDPRARTRVNVRVYGGGGPGGVLGGVRGPI
eukprot:7783084-Pyramimonas_sp.AAC.1